MKTIAIFLIFTIAQVASAEPDKMAIEDAKYFHEFDVKPGRYDKRKMFLLSVGETYCYTFKITKPYYHEKWASTVGLLFNNKEDNKSVHVRLFPKSRELKKYALEYSYQTRENETVRTIEKSYLFEGFKNGQAVKINLNISKNRQLCMEHNTIIKCRELQFEPSNLSYIGVSSKAELSVAKGKCI